MEAFKDYLIQKGYSVGTIQSYITKVKMYEGWCSEHKKAMERSTYNTILKFMEHLRRKG